MLSAAGSAAVAVLFNVFLIFLDADEKDSLMTLLKLMTAALSGAHVLHKNQKKAPVVDRFHVMSCQYYIYAVQFHAASPLR